MRRAGYTNSMVTPVTWTDNNVVGHTALNYQLRNNILAIDNRATPLTPDIIHYTVPGAITVNNQRVLIPASMTGVNLLALGEYSPNIALSVDASVSFSNVTASAVCVEAIVKVEDIENTSNAGLTYYKYRMFRVPEWATQFTLKDPPIGMTNYVSGIHLGETNYAFWSGYVRNDMLGNNPFVLTKPMYSARPMLLVSATNGSVDLNYSSWALRFRANVAVSVQNPATNYDPGVSIYGGTAF